MEQAEKLRELLEKLRRNKEKVPLPVLKTKYKAAYEKLLEDIKTEAKAYALPIATRLPGWISGRPVKEEYAERIGEEFNRIYAEGDYAHRIGQALYKRYSADEVRQLAEEINRSLQAAVKKIFDEATCLYTTAENWNPENPVIPKIYNDLVDKFYDETIKQWRDPQPGEKKDALLIFIKGDKEKGGQEHEQKQEAAEKKEVATGQQPATGPAATGTGGAGV